MLSLWLAVAVVVIAVVMFIVAADTRNRFTSPQSTPSPSAPSPSPGPTWYGPFDAGMAPSNAMPIDLGDVILLQSRFDGPVSAFDLATRKTTFTVAPDSQLKLAGGDDTVVAIVGDQIEAFDAKTGKVTDQAAAPSSATMVLWVGDGMVLVEDSVGGTICARLIADLGTCVWQASSMYVAGDYVFGGGRWVNTGDGVVDVKTGQPASFGWDAGNFVGDDIYYEGASDARVFRVDVNYNANVSPSQSTTYEPWDVTTDTVISPPVTADKVYADQSSSAYIAVVNTPYAATAANRSTTNAYSWQTGELLWSKPSGTYHYELKSLFAGGSFLMPMPDESSIESIIAVDPATGNVTWQSDLYYENYIGNTGDTVYTVGTLIRAVGAGDQMMANNAAHGFTTIWQSPMPEQPAFCQAHLAASYLYCLDSTYGKIYVASL